MSIIKMILEWLFGRKSARVQTSDIPAAEINDAEESAPQKKLPDIPPLKRDFLTSKTECEFYHNLIRVVPEQYVVMAKTRIEDVIRIPYNLRNYFKSRHFDFLIVDKKSMYPRLVVELDDATHKNPKAEYADALKTKVCKAARLTMIRYPAARTYDNAALSKTITELLPKHLAEA